MLAVEQVACGYGRQVILADVTFRLAEGEVLCLLGPNGVGKTTLFKTILGLLKLMAGDIRVEGASVVNLPPREKARLMAYVPQFHTPPFPYRAGEVVLMGRTAYLGGLNSPIREDQRQALKAMERLGIAHLKDRIYSELSGGERQLVLIARAIGQHPKILMMDEPTSNLDFGNQARMLAQIQALAEQGLTVILTTHLPDHAWLCSHQVALIQPDRQVAVGPRDELMTEANLTEIYGVPIKIIEVPDLNGKMTKTCLAYQNR
jgi:iron complex transport system ATP-binding protein